MSVRPHGTTRLPLEGFSWNLIFKYFFKNISRVLKFYLNLSRINDTLHEDQYTFLIISRPVLPTMRNISDKSCRETRNAHCVLNNFFFIPKIMPFMRWCGKYIVERGRLQLTIWRMRVSCLIPRAIDTHTQNMQYLVLFHCNNGCTNTTHCCVIRNFLCYF